MGTVKRKEACASCIKHGGDTSQDNRVVYDDDSYYCFACGDFGNTKPMKNQPLLKNGEFEDLKDRGLSKQTCEKYSISQAKFRDELVHIFPVFNKNEQVKQKIRNVNEKKFTQVGDTANNNLFGQHLFNPSENIHIVVTEGEFDAAAVHQSTQFPAVSVFRGAGGALKEVQANFEWLNSWKHVVFCFDSDEPGRKAAAECAELFEPGKARIASLPLKDANEMLLAGRTEELKKCIWNASITKPDTIVFPNEIKLEAMEKPKLGISWPWPTLTKITYGYRQGELYHVFGPTGCGKEQPLSAKISTPCGWKKMGDICLGDKIHTPNGDTAIVQGIFPQGGKSVYKITFEDGRSCEAGLDHLWLVRTKSQIKKFRKNKRKNGYVLSTKELMYIDFKKFSIPLCKPVDYTEKQYRIPPYSLGVLLGDGCLTGAGIQISSNEKDILDRVSAELGLEYTVNKHNYTKTFLSGSFNKTYRNYLNKVGLCVKSQDKFIPKEYLLGSVDQRLDLLCGLMDTDGHVSSTGSYTYTTTSTKLKNDFLELVYSLGFIASVREDRRSKYKSGVCFTIHIKTKEIIFKSLKHIERYNKAKNGRNRKYHYDHLRIKNIEYVRQELSQCIYVDSKDHLYVTDNFITTHNTEFTEEIIQWLITQNIHCGVFTIEQRPADRLRRMVSKRLNKRLYLPGTDWGDVSLVEKEIDYLSDKVAFYDPGSGSLSIDKIMINMRYLNKTYKTQFFVLDNLKALSTNPLIDGKHVSDFIYMSHVVSKMFLLSRELNVTILLINHVRKNDISVSAKVSSYDDYNGWNPAEAINAEGLTWETGRVPNVGDIYGGGNINDLVDFTIALSRNTVSPDPLTKRTMYAKVLKSRLDSRYTGTVFKLLYDYETGRLLEEINNG